MSYGIIWDKNALDFLNKVDRLVAKRIIIYVKSFAENPRARQFKKLKGEKGFRLRVGDYRVIFDFDVKQKTIQVLDIGHRKNIY